MKTEPADIDKGLLAERIASEYGLHLSRLTFLPKGEDAYAYLGEGPEGKRYFVRAQPAHRARDLAAAYIVTYWLRTHGQLEAVVAPHPTRAGALTADFHRFTLAVFPYVAGRTLYEQAATDDDLMQAAAILAALHSVADAPSASPPRRERFDNPFREPVLRALDEAGKPASGHGSYRAGAKRLLAAHRDDLLATLEMMDRFQAELPLLDLDWALTHGDPNLDNFLKDVEGRLYLTDWGEVGQGPAERDLAAFIGPRFELFLRHYTAARGATRLHLEVFAFYFYRWSLQEIADYSTRLLFHQMGPLEDEHSWAELQDYLPVRHAAIEQSLAEVEAVVGRVLG